jgi:hypothetical protein
MYWSSERASETQKRKRVIFFTSPAVVAWYQGRKTKGRRGRKAKAKAREEAEERRMIINHTTDGQQQQSLESQLQQLQMQMGDAPAISQNGVGKCWHGLETSESEDICAEFVLAFMTAFWTAAGHCDRLLSECLNRAEVATLDEFDDVWSDSAKMELAKSYCLYIGAQNILKGDYNIARDYASLTRYFDQYIAVELQKTQALINWPKINELGKGSDEHTLVKFFRRRIPCTCLDEKYEEVKSITKMGLCWNPRCQFPDRLVKRSQTMYCSRCRSVTYCSRECQKADRTVHKLNCDIGAALTADFEAKSHKQNAPIS